MPLSGVDIGVLNGLISAVIDSARAFENASDDTDSPRLAQLFRDLAEERREIVTRLQEGVTQLGGTPNDDRSLIGGLHRRLEDLQDALLAGEEATLDELERGEARLQGKFEEALAVMDLLPETRELIDESLERVRSGLERAGHLQSGVDA